MNKRVLKKCVDREYRIPEADQLELLSKIFTRFFYVKDKLYILYEDDIYNIKETELATYIETEFPESKIFVETGKRKVEKWVFDFKVLKAYLKINHYQLVHYVIDPFLPAGRVEADHRAKEIRIFQNKIRLIKPSTLSIDEGEKKKIINDYHRHFPLLQEFLDFIVASRFSVSRKKSFLYLRAPSDWGKSFLFGALSDLGVAFEMRYSDFSEDKPVSIEPLQLRNSLVVYVDEFKYFPKEMKNLTHHKLVEPKFGFREKVEVYGKVMLSAEQSESFIGGVDDQIINRLIIFDLNNYGVSKLSKNIMYSENTALYKDVITEYIYDQLAWRIDEYLGLGKYGASKKGDSVLEKLWQKYKISAKEKLDIAIKKLYYEFFEELKSKNEEDMSYREKEIKSNIYIDMMDDTIKIFKVDKTLDSILRECSDDSFYAKAKHKKSIIKNLIGEYKNSLRAGNKVSSGLLVDMKKLKEEIMFAEGGEVIFGGRKIEYSNKDELLSKMNDVIRDHREEGKDARYLLEEINKMGFTITPVYDEEKNLIGVM